MAIGVPCEEFWHGDYSRLKNYEDAYQIKTAQENQARYMQGLYNYKAFESVIAMFSYGLGGKKGQKPDGYLTAPIPITEMEKAADKKRKAEKSREWFMKGQEDG